MLKETDIADWYFIYWPLWFEDGFIQVNIGLSKENFRYLQNDANKICFTFAAYIKWLV